MWLKYLTFLCILYTSLADRVFFMQNHNSNKQWWEHIQTLFTETQANRSSISQARMALCLLFCIQCLCERVRGTARQVFDPLLEWSYKSEVLFKPLWPLCSWAAVFTLAPLELNKSHIFLTLGSSRLTQGQENSMLPVSHDQSTHCLFSTSSICVWMFRCVNTLIKPKYIISSSVSWTLLFNFLVHFICKITQMFCWCNFKQTLWQWLKTYTDV